MADANTHPSVSVVLPTYNRAAVIGRSICSVLNQTYADFELIVVDDGSTDETSRIVTELGDLRIVYVRLSTNNGAGAARNVGVRLSKGQFLSFQDSDDEWLPGKLAQQMMLFEQGSPKLGVVYSDMQRVSKDGAVTYYASPAWVPKRLINPTTRSYQLYGLGIQSTLIRRECFDVVGYFNEDLPAFEDLEVFIRLSKHYDFHHIATPFVNYYENDGLSADMQANRLARKILLKLYGKELSAENPVFLIYEQVWLHATQARYFVGRRMLEPLLQRIYRAGAKCGIGQS